MGNARNAVLAFAASSGRLGSLHTLEGSAGALSEPLPERITPFRQVSLDIGLCSCSTVSSGKSDNGRSHRMQETRKPDSAKDQRPVAGRWVSSIMEQRQEATRKATEARVAAAKMEGWS